VTPTAAPLTNRGAWKTTHDPTRADRTEVRQALCAPRRRDATGQFKHGDDVGRSLALDRMTKAKRAAKKGQGDKDRSRAKT
jgi:hypothetical protein